MVNRGDQKTCGNADRLLRVLVLDLTHFGIDTLGKDHNQIWSNFEVWLVLVRASGASASSHSFGAL
jgi:hypothetical protein